MRWFVAGKTFRWLMAASVSLWMGGAGCLFACSSGFHEAEKSTSSSEVVVTGNSCATSASHDCCAKQQTEALAKKSQTVLPSLATLPRGMMEDCPLAVNATAVVSKAGSDLSDVGQARATWSSQVVTSTNIPKSDFVSLLPANRGPTYLRCCVFLI